MGLFSWLRRGRARDGATPWRPAPVPVATYLPDWSQEWLDAARRGTDPSTNGTVAPDDAFFTQPFLVSDGAEGAESGAADPYASAWGTAPESGSGQPEASRFQPGPDPGSAGAMFPPPPPDLISQLPDDLLVPGSIPAQPAAAALDGAIPASEAGSAGPSAVEPAGPAAPAEWATDGAGMVAAVPGPLQEGPDGWQAAVGGTETASGFSSTIALPPPDARSRVEFLPPPVPQPGPAVDPWGATDLPGVAGLPAASDNSVEPGMAAAWVDVEPSGPDLVPQVDIRASASPGGAAEPEEGVGPVHQVVLGFGDGTQRQLSDDDPAARAFHDLAAALSENGPVTR
jgi:hypothetical protein